MMFIADILYTRSVVPDCDCSPDWNPHNLKLYPCVLVVDTVEWNETCTVLGPLEWLRRRQIDSNPNATRKHYSSTVV